MWDASFKKKSLVGIASTSSPPTKTYYAWPINELQHSSTFCDKSGSFAQVCLHLSVLEVKGEDLRHHVWFARVVTSLPLGFSASFPQTPINNVLTMVLFKIAGWQLSHCICSTKKQLRCWFFSFPRLGESNSYSFSTKARRKKESEQFRSRQNCAIGCPYQQNLNEVKQHARLTTFPKKTCRNKVMEKQRKHMKMSIVQQVELVLGQLQETIGHGECCEAKKARSDASVWHDMLPFRWGWNFLQITKYLSMNLHGFKADFHNLSFTKPSCENCTSKQIYRIPTKIYVIFSNLSSKNSIPMQNFTNISKKLVHIVSQCQPTPRTNYEKKTSSKTQ